jgi:hypothetical protein
VLFVGVNAASLWGAFYPRPYGLAVGFQAALPLVALMAMVVFRGQVQFDDTGKKGRPPSVAYAFVAPILVLAARSLLTWHLLGWSGLWIPFAAIGGGLFALVLVCAPEVRKKASTAVVVACFCLVYAFGLLLHINCFYDDSWPTSYESRVRAHRFSSGRRTTTYDLVVYPWLDRPEEHQVSVSQPVYGRHGDGDAVRILVRGGRLGMPWYEVY